MSGVKNPPDGGNRVPRVTRDWLADSSYPLSAKSKIGCILLNLKIRNSLLRWDMYIYVGENMTVTAKVLIYI